MHTAELIELLNQNDIYPYVVNGKLKTRSDSADIAAELATMIRENRDALIAFLQDDALAIADMTKIPKRMDTGTAPLSFAQQRLLFVVSALQELFQDENFTNLLRAEGLDTLPKYLAERVWPDGRRA